jgi:hypothetical protein
MVAAMAAMILAVVLGVGRVVGDFLFHGCEQVNAQLSAGGQCVAPDAPQAPAAGAGDGKADPPVQPASSTGQGGDESPPASATNDLGISDDM